MLLRHAYYCLKPWIPKRVRRHLRRRLALRLRDSFLDVWPILDSAGRKPAGWTGWPGSKQFALVLTHDVEGQVGLDRYPQLARLEERLGFRSSFNFVPEGEYRVSREQRQSLESEGFEIGVHDLRHDGLLYASRSSFRRKAGRIAQYLSEWNAVGFRSGFMLHRLDWLHELGALYDSSTFDTDPFEPQPDGVETIFPFWVPNPALNRGLVRETPWGAKEGYVELPYTLPQDSTLFGVFGERSIDIWLRKTRWLVEHGGMVLINVHPDYMLFGSERSTGAGYQYPAQYYEDFLAHLRNEYAGAFWNPVPKEIASEIRSRAEPKRVPTPAVALG
jgi:hypothetical protein